MNGRYAVQQRLDEVGEAGQRRLEQAEILVIGAGGLGCALLSWLAGAGIGHLRIVDPDRVERSNLHRQPLYCMEDLGRLKAEVAQERLLALNPDICVSAHVVSAQPDNLEDWLQDASLVVDAADRFAVTYALSDACFCRKRPLISASVSGWGGYAGVFCGNGPSYRAVFPEFGMASATCGQEGVLGPVVAMLGSLQAQLCLSLLLGISPSPMSQLFRWEAKTGRLSRFSFINASEPAHVWPFLAVSCLQEKDVLVDVRALDEQPVFFWSGKRVIPLDHLEACVGSLPRHGRLVLCCRTGLRAARAACFLAQQGFSDLALLALEGQTL